MLVSLLYGALGLQCWGSSSDLLRKAMKPPPPVFFFQVTRYCRNRVVCTYRKGWEKTPLLQGYIAFRESLISQVVSPAP